MLYTISKFYTLNIILSSKLYNDARNLDFMLSDNHLASIVPRFSTKTPYVYRNIHNSSYLYQAAWANIHKEYRKPNLNERENYKKINQSITLIKLLMKNVLPYDLKVSASGLSQFISNIELLIRDNPSSFVPILKILSNWLKVSFLSGDYSQRNIPLGLWSESGSCPTYIRPVIDLLRLKKDKNVVAVFKIMMSVLNIYKVTIVPGDPNISTITDDLKSGLDLRISISNKEIENALSLLSFSSDNFRSALSQEILQSKWHFTGASGPNGNAIWSAHLDSAAVMMDEEVLLNLKEFNKIQGTEFIINALERSSVSEKVLEKLIHKKPIHSKIHYLFEKGDKVRLIAISDYFTQESLNYLHNTIQAALSTLEMDYTSSHFNGFLKVKEWSLHPDANLFSFDLSAATDRLPVSLQSRILSILFNDNYANSWKNLVVNRDWELPSGEKVRYSVGQPMGTKSSFVMLGLLHHVLVQIAANRVGLTPFKDYVIVGDDIVINNSSVATSYKELINDIGVDINTNKSIIPHYADCRGAEFCSKLCINGIDASPLPVKLFQKIWDNREFLPQLQNELFMCFSDFLTSKNYWNFLASFCSKVDLLGMAKLNGLPKSVTGLSRPNLPDGYEDFDFESFMSQYKVNLNDLENFYKYVIICDQLKRVDAILRDSTSSIQAILSWTKSENYTPVGFAQTGKLSDWLSEIIAINDRSFFHPVQEIARSEANRVAEILSELMIGDIDLKLLLKKGTVQSIRTKLDAKSLLLGHMQDSSVLDIYRRRLLDKTLRLIISCAVTDRTRVLTQSLTILFLDQNWSVSVGIGQSVIVSPIGVNIGLSENQAQNHLKASLKGENLLTTMYSITPEIRRDYHPEQRLTASPRDKSKLTTQDIIKGSR